MTMNAKLSEIFRIVAFGGGGAARSTTATTAMGSTAWLDFKDLERAIFIIWRVKGTGNITANTGIYGSTAATGTSPVAISTLGLTTAITGVLTAAVGTILKVNAGHAVFDINRDTIAAAGENLRYVMPRMRKKTRADRIACVAYCWAKTAKSGNIATGDKTATVAIA